MPIPYDSIWFIILFGLAFQIYPNTSSPQKKNTGPRHRRTTKEHHAIGGTGSGATMSWAQQLWATTLRNKKGMN